MLHYNIYNYITDQEFVKIENKLAIIEKKMAFKLDDWKLTMPIKKSDGLIVDFTIKEKNFMGNIGLTYIDEPRNKPMFSFYVTKCYDKFNIRYFVREYLYTSKYMSFYDRKIDFIVDEAVNLYSSWDKEYIFEHNIEY